MPDRTSLFLSGQDWEVALPCDVYMVDPREHKAGGMTISTNHINIIPFLSNLIGLKTKQKREFP